MGQSKLNFRNCWIQIQRNWEAGLRYRYAGKTPFAAVNQTQTLVNYPQVTLDYNNLGEQKLDAFSQLDLRIDKKWNFKKFAFNIFLDIQNALAQKTPQPIEFGLNRDTSGQIISPRTLMPVDGAQGNVLPSLGIILDF